MVERPVKIFYGMVVSYAEQVREVIKERRFTTFTTGIADGTQYFNQIQPDFPRVYLYKIAK